MCELDSGSGRGGFVGLVELASVVLVANGTCARVLEVATACMASRRVARELVACVASGSLAGVKQRVEQDQQHEPMRAGPPISPLP